MSRQRIVITAGGNELAAANGPLVLGSRLGCDVVVDDPVIAARHCEFSADGGSFRVRDLGSVSGTWVGGRPTSPSTELQDGSVIVIGTAQLRASIAAEAGTTTLTLELERGAFWWKKPGKGVFDNDPDALVRSEVGFGRFPALHLGNRLAMLVAVVLLIGATFTATVMEPLADPGPLQPPHALLSTAGAIAADAHDRLRNCAALVAEQGCSVCHTTGQGTPEQKCLQCHGDLAAKETWRHPYLGDGVTGDLPKVAAEGFCVVCHVDHAGKEWLKPASAQLVGKCEACHAAADGAFDAASKQALLAKHPIAVATSEQPYATYRFPHDVHVQKEIACTICHRLDPEQEARAKASLPDDPRRQDFTEVPFDVCASCHVPQAQARGMTAAEQERFRAADHQWPVTWHGTDDGGKHCLVCHTQGERDGIAVYGPEFRTTPRGRWTPAEHAAERARYTTPRRRHEEQFAAHAQGKECTSCHVSGAIAVDATAPTKTFWHALHLGDGALQPAAGQGAVISGDAKVGCVSCHGDLRGSKDLLAASTAAYHWPDNEQARAACTTCHRDGERELAPAATASGPVPEARRSAAIEFPHDVHVTSALFAKAGGKLAEGCFACHEFAAGGSDALTMVPRTKAEAADCRACHQGHDHIGGGSCQQCHPATAGGSNSFLIAARVAVSAQLPGRSVPVPAPPVRSWPRNDTFSHLSTGHSGEGITCATCHDAASIGKSDSLANVPIPSDAHPSCRECHLQQQFHWR